MNLAFDPSFRYIEKLRYHEDELGLILKGHLIIEHILNRLIDKEMKDTDSIIKNTNQFTFSVKLQLLYSSGLLNEESHRNIKRINRLRNEFAHNFEPNKDKIDFIISTRDSAGNVEDIKAKVAPMNVNYKERKYIKVLCLHTLTLLRNEWLIRYGSESAPELVP